MRYHSSFERERLPLRPVKLCLQEGSRSRDEDIHFEHGFTVNDVETGLALDGLGHHFLIDVELFLQRSDKRLEMFEAHIGDNIRILRSAHPTIQSAGK